MAGENITTAQDSVCIGLQAGSALSTSGSQLYIARSNAAAANNPCWIYGDGSGNVTQGNNSTSWSQGSDERIKKNIVDSPKGLTEVNQIRVVNFEYRTPEEITAEGITGSDGVGVQTGIIAQELEVPFPESVFEGIGGKKQTKNDAVVWAMVKAIQELSTENEVLKARLTAGGL